MHEGLPKEEAAFLSTRKWENSMSVGCGDLDADGFPEAVVGTGTPDWGHYDFALCNLGNDTSGWRGLARCDHGDPRNGMFGRHGDTRTHGFAFGDIDADGSTELILVTGGFALADEGMPLTLASMVEECKSCRDVCVQGSHFLVPASAVDSARLKNRATQANCTWPFPCPLAHDGRSIVCDSRSGAFVYAAPLPHRVEAKTRTAHLRLRGLGTPGGSASDAIGARLKVTADGAWRRHRVVTSAHGFNSQDSAWQPVPVGQTGNTTVEIAWPSGRQSVVHVAGGDRLDVSEPAS